MQVEVIMPRMGQGMEEGRVLSWLKPVGAAVKRGEVIAEIETDKAVVELESFITGTLVEILLTEGDTAVIGEVIAYIDDGRTELTIAPTPDLKPAETGLSEPSESIAPNEREEETKPGLRKERVDVSPVARRLAREHGLDLAQVQGTGPGGRIVKKDIKALLDSQHLTSIAQVGIDQAKRVVLPRRKQAIARRMLESKTTAPHFYLSMDIEMERALLLRDSLKNRGVEISINDLILRATTLALVSYPNLNASFAGDEIHIHQNINLSIAVALEQGLITPVIHNCKELSLIDLAAAVKELVSRARTDHLRPVDLEGGTFTVTNLGMFGVKHFAAIINPPQSMILSVGSVRRVPVFDMQDHVVPAKILAATVSADHRVTDGMEAAYFLQTIKSLLEDGFVLETAP